MRAQSGEEMKTISNNLISAAAVAALSVLLLAGCQQGNSKESKKPPVGQKEALVDTAEEDSNVLNERMQRWRLIQVTTSGWESDK